MESGLFGGLEDLRGEALERELAGSASHIDAAFARQLVLIRVCLPRTASVPLV